MLVNDNPYSFVLNTDQNSVLAVPGAKEVALELNSLSKTFNMAGFAMARRKIDAVIVGADRITKNGDVANKIGTYSVAVLAEKHGIPFYVAAPESTFDKILISGDQIIVEERDSKEVTEVLGRRIAPDGAEVWSPAFDITPHQLVSSYITDTGVRPGGRS